ncbi:YNL190W [Zygosaccharomyces parabailii]|uniref:ZYBA0S04-01552g1_1 n=1 Tax=Zygosaccharomyces bailii (strain CLIB 213 / ATCC 58445 / CBS 680 / BCRC 21525 / NBRC 1098 / NCYC 1416 / NRRL Y-2227) TaxID=1333698 RepID=A0A8J2WZA8_ZYGB2|nr:YNL190W [Zygosaccharomyces parabailii]CDF89325.1 ZYBA0S04-01552g1_1 [Zygosaccharomyces bailii CLIB 213]CDH08283.1 uncharacterized protein ZBAI_00065 [Zygosaccharomyces bailii ISA1307]SJM85695.1 uncharacterized protein ZBIST_2401 [Zygosaccharomyces bailii]AQZ14557.1 YNL190W [Zygosaccharomyces parabailii]
MKLFSLSVAAVAAVIGLAPQVEANIPGTVTVTSYGTHKYGKFDKTSRTHNTDTTGTHKYGKFDNTRQVTKTAHVTHLPNGAGRGASNFGAAKKLGLTAGTGLVAGALLLL